MAPHVRVGRGALRGAAEVGGGVVAPAARQRPTAQHRGAAGHRASRRRRRLRTPRRRPQAHGAGNAKFEFRNPIVK